MKIMFHQLFPLSIQQLILKELWKYMCHLVWDQSHTTGNNLYAILACHAISIFFWKIVTMNFKLGNLRNWLVLEWRGLYSIWIKSGKKNMKNQFEISSNVMFRLITTISHIFFFVSKKKKKKKVIYSFYVNPCWPCQSYHIKIT